MTAQIIHMPSRIYPAPIDRAEHVEDARAVLRNAAHFDDQIIRDACLILQAWGDVNDWVEADAMMLALQMKRRPVAPTRRDYIEALPAFVAFILCFGVLPFAFLSMGVTP